MSPSGNGSSFCWGSEAPYATRHIQFDHGLIPVKPHLHRFYLGWFENQAHSTLQLRRQNSDACHRSYRGSSRQWLGMLPSSHTFRHVISYRRVITSALDNAATPEICDRPGVYGQISPKTIAPIRCGICAPQLLHLYILWWLHLEYAPRNSDRVVLHDAHKCHAESGDVACMHARVRRRMAIKASCNLRKTPRQH